MGPKRGPNRIVDAEALRKPLGGLLERSWSFLEPKKVILESLLAALGGLSRQVSAKKGSKMGPICTLRFLVFEVPSWGPKSDPHFRGFQKDFEAFQDQI